MKKTAISLIATMLSHMAFADIYVDANRQDAIQIDLKAGQNVVQLMNFEKAQHIYCSFLRGNYRISQISDSGTPSHFVSNELNGDQAQLVGFDVYVADKGHAAAGGRVTFTIDADHDHAVTLVCAPYSSEVSDGNNSYLGALHRVDQAWENQFSDAPDLEYLRTVAATKLIKDAAQHGFNTQSEATALLAGEISQFVGNMIQFNTEMNEAITNSSGTAEQYFMANQAKIMQSLVAFLDNVSSILKEKPLRQAEKSFLKAEFEDLLNDEISDGLSIRGLLQHLQAREILAQIAFIESKLAY